MPPNPICHSLSFLCFQLRNNSHPTCTKIEHEATSASAHRILHAKAIGGRPDLHKKAGATASRSMYRMIGRLGLKWDIPISEVIFHTDVGLELTIPYIKPSDALTYTLKKHPEVALGGYTSVQEGASLLSGFWKTYRHYHPTHAVYEVYPESLEYCLPIYLYGDEGRGRRRGNTAMVMFESPFGIRTASTSHTKKRCHKCSCCPEEPSRKKFCGDEQKAVRLDNPCFAMHNYKEHSFLTRFLLFCLPCATYKAFPQLIPFLMDLICQDLRRMFYEGIQVGNRLITPVFLGLKADIKFHHSISNFSRWYTRMGRTTDIPYCHECLAGAAGLPAEDISERPSWEQTIFTQRPWDSQPVLTQVPFDRNRPESMHRRDPFHTLKMGLFRHVTGSILAVCILWGYFHDEDSADGNSIPILIKRSHGHFRLWASTFKKSPALRSFSKALMNWPNLSTSPWFNTKGSDVMLLVKWLYDYIGLVLLNPKQPDHIPVLKVMRSVLGAARDQYNLMVSHPLLLERTCAVQLYEHITVFLNGYAWLARWALDNEFVAFAMVYKIHAWKHEALDLFRVLKNPTARYFFNPLIHSCEINEDVIGRISRLSRRVDSRQMERRCLQLFLVKCHFLTKRAFSNLQHWGPAQDMRSDLIWRMVVKKKREQIRQNPCWGVGVVFKFYIESIESILVTVFPCGILIFLDHEPRSCWSRCGF